MAERSCRRCGCTEADCSGCVARTGAPCTWVEADLCSACVDLVLPREMTPAIVEVLGMPCFETGSLADVFRGAGHTIKRRLEDEQAFVLWRWLALALIHGDGWRSYASADLDGQLAIINAGTSKRD